MLTQWPSLRHSRVRSIALASLQQVPVTKAEARDESDRHSSGSNSNESHQVVPSALGVSHEHLVLSSNSASRKARSPGSIQSDNADDQRSIASSQPRRQSITEAMLSELLQQPPIALGDSEYALRAQASSVVHIGSQPLARTRRPPEHSSEAIDVVDAMESASASHQNNAVVGVSIWRLVLVLALAVESFAVPFRAVFDQQEESDFVILKEHWWLLDVLLCFLLAWHVLVGLFQTPSVGFRSIERLKDLRASRAYLRGRFRSTESANQCSATMPFSPLFRSPRRVRLWSRLL